MRTIYALSACAFLLALAGCVRAKSGEDETAILQRLHLPKANGRTPVLYSRASEATALRYQQALTPAHEWFESQLQMRVPATLAVLDEADWAKVTNTPIPHADSRSGTLFVPEHLERASTVRPPGLDYALAGEAVLLHEVGHLFFDKLSIQGSGFVNEMVPNLFMAAYIRAARSDLVFMLGGPLASTPEPRYTSGADFIYLREYVGIDNYFWFQMHLQRLADFCLSKGSLSSVLAKIQAEFPGGRSYQLPVDQTVRSLDRLFPGFVEAAGSLAAPSTIRLIQPASCPKVILGGEAPVRQLVIRNYTPDPVLIVKSDGTTTTADPGAWRRLGVTGPARLPDGSCLVPEDEPVLAVLQK